MLSASAGALLTGPLCLPSLWALSVLACSLAFIRQAYVFSLSYGVATAAVGATLLLSLPALPLAPRLHCALVVAYGARLFAFLYWRQVGQKGSGWAAKIEALDKTPRAERGPLVLSTALFYALLTSPAAFSATSLTPFTPLVKAGAAAAAAGLLIESVADLQKSLSKIALRKSGAASRLCTTGLYARCRHPNYAGEILFWVGSFTMGVPAILSAPSLPAGLLRAACSGLGLAGIVFIMLSATKRLEGRQAEAAPTVWPVLLPNGELDSYAKYTARSGKLMPKLG